MKYRQTILFNFIFVITVSQLRGQEPNQVYTELINRSHNLYLSKEYKKSALTYSKAFAVNPGSSRDLYNAACSWALSKQLDSSFYYLFKVTTEMKYHNYEHISNDGDLAILHSDSKWWELLAIIKLNKLNVEKKYNVALVKQLDSIYESDQKYRQQYVTAIEKNDTKEINYLTGKIRRTDSINVEKVKLILNHFGWLGSESIGERGNSTLFLVIQHSDVKTRQKYLPMMRVAVHDKKASSKDLALLEDRTALNQGKKQIYGSQLGRDDKTKKYYLLPLEDPANVDKRRAKMGLIPIAEYLKQWGVTWSVQTNKN